jgi:aryl-alcohol dehydrogenase-like predicted oxidoreductase
LAERRFGHFLHNQKRDDYVISSKVGKLLKASKNAIQSNLFHSPVHPIRWSLITRRPGAPFR